MPSNPVTLQSLLPPITSDQVEAILLQTLQGIGPVQQIGQGGGQVSVIGVPVANYDAIVNIAVSGALGSSAFTYSLDGGLTTAGPYIVPVGGSYGIAGSGLTLGFAGTFVAGDKYLFQTIYPAFQATDFESGSAALTFIKTEATTEADLAGSAIPNIASGGFVDFASSKDAPNDWLTLLSQQLYDNDRFDPTIANGVASLTLASTASAQTFSPGDLIVSNSLGSGPNVFQYTNGSGFTISPGATITVAVQATAPGAAFNLANGTVSTLITPRPGLTCTNPAPGTSAVTPSGGATGTLSVTGSANGNFNVLVQAVTSGALGTATAQVSLDGGSDFGAPFTIPGSGVYALPTLDGVGSTGLTLHFGGTFTAADTYSFTAYASWLLVRGTDLESAVSLQTRDKARWPTLGVTQANPSLVWTLLVQGTPNGGSEVAKVRPVPDATVGGQLNITVAGATGPISTSALVAISAYVGARAPLGTKTVVSNALVQTLPVVGTVYVVASQLSGAQAAIDVAFRNLAAATPIEGVVDYASIVDAIESQKSSGVNNVHVTSPAPNVDTQLNPISTVQFDLTGLTYVLQ